ncbi:4'-phosphopantetheinyl transferase superfamily protein [Streptomyces varsoviensis]|uniref:4'-phosphopantetheinyl transferase family protein n=1 Tax=Streptomyces varsoviensis TaxID=67373 RepID=UPI0033E8837C
MRGTPPGALRHPHVWLVDLAELAAGRGSVRAAAHLALRSLAAHHLGCRPADVPLVRHCPRCGTGDHGRLVLTGPAAVHLSLSHSADLAAIALCGGPVGVDVERVRPDVDWQRLAKRVLAPREAPPQGRERNWFELWTAKEAVLKLAGRGFAQPLSGITFTAPDAAGWSRAGVAPRTGTAEDVGWVRRLSAPAGFAAALAVARRAPPPVVRGLRPASSDEITRWADEPGRLVAATADLPQERDTPQESA